MRASDAFSWHLERDPALRSTVVSIAWLTKSPGWERLVDAVDTATRAVPRFRQCVVLPPAGLSPPLWITDHGFDLSWHLRRVAASAPRTSQVVLDLAAIEATTPFELARPLWVFTLVEHLESGQAALIMKVHHSLTDGVGGMQLALSLFDQQQRSSRARPVVADDDRRVTSAGVLRASLLHSWAQVLSTGGQMVRSSVPTTIRTFLHPRSTISGFAATVRSVVQTVAPVRTTLSPLMTGRSLSRRLVMLAVPLEDLDAAAHSAGGTVNDAFLAGVTGGLRRYHALHGAGVEELRVAMPVSIRTAKDPLASNRITLMRFALPVAESDAADRLRTIHDRSREASTAPSLPLTGAISAGLNLLPSGAVAGMLKHVDFVASDVVGFPFPVYLAGAGVTVFVAFGPTIGTAANFTLVSYDNTCYLGINLDAAAVPDPELLMSCFQDGFEEVIAIGGRHRSVRVGDVRRPPTDGARTA